MSWLKNNIAWYVLAALVVIIPTAGWVMSVVKFVRTDFEKPYKAEIIYGIGTFTGTGAIIGWFNIED